MRVNACRNDGAFLTSRAGAFGQNTAARIDDHGGA
jgi:hypothetical protein